MKKFGYIFFNYDKVKDDTGTDKIEKVVGLKTNEDLKILSKFERNVESTNYKKSLYTLFSLFEEWVQNPYELKFVTFEPNDMKYLIEECKQIHFKSKTRDFHKVMSFQYWNIQNEMVYRMGLRKEQASLKELLSIYGLSFVGKSQSASELCYNTYSLATHFRLDGIRNKEVFKKTDNHTKVGKEKNRSSQILNFLPIRAKGEETLREKVQEGWNVTIECKLNDNGFGMTYEGTAYPLIEDLKNKCSVLKKGQGNTLEELMHTLFEEDKKCIKA